MNKEIAKTTQSELDKFKLFFEHIPGEKSKYTSSRVKRPRKYIVGQ